MQNCHILLDLQSINGICHLSFTDNGGEFKNIFAQTLTKLCIRCYTITAHSHNQNGKIEMSNCLIRKVLKQLPFSYTKICETRFPFNKLQILTTFAFNIVNNQPPNKSPFSRQILYHGLCSFAKHNIIDKNISN